jgi:glycosyltransferase involved in cell wall biosynthesis
LIEDWSLGAALRGELQHLNEALRLEPADVVHLIYPDPYLRYGSDSYHLPFLLKFAGARRLVVTFFGFAVTRSSLVTKLGLLGLFATADRIVVTDLALHKRFQRTFPFWAGKSRAGFVGGIAGKAGPKWSATALERQRAELTLHGSDRLIGFFGFWSADKGLEDLIGAVRLLRDAGENVKLILIGGREVALRTDYERTIGVLIRELGLQDAVIETGPLSADDVTRYLLALDVCVLPFRVNPLGRSSLAIALTLGVPTVVSRPIVGQEVLQGLVQIEPRDPKGLAAAIRSVLADPAAQTHAGEAGAAVSAHWSWDSITEAYLADYQKVSAAS